MLPDPRSWAIVDIGAVQVALPALSVTAVQAAGRALVPAAVDTRLLRRDGKPSLL